MAESRSTTLTNHNPSNYIKHANFVYSDKYTSAVFDLLAPKAGESIVDLGCGSGQLTGKIKEAVGDGEVYGLDSSEAMLEHARSSTSGITYIRADIMDHSTLDPGLKGKFDAVFSSATFHWCKANPGGVVDTIKWLLKPGGRVAFEFGGFGNVVGVRAAIHEVLRRKGVDPYKHDPWYFPTAAQYAKLLAEHGLEPHEVALYPRPTPLPTDLLGWLKTFARNTYFSTWSDEEAHGMLEEVVTICTPDAHWSSAAPGEGRKVADAGDDVEEGWEVMYVRLRGSAVSN